MKLEAIKRQAEEPAKEKMVTMLGTILKQEKR
jgi:hypothetical protein